MTNFIPIFPLNIVVFPGEELNLHIFEPRYKQLINDCYSENKAFGIPTIIGNEVMEYGTLVKITNIRKVYDDGKMDIQTSAGEIFRVLEIIKELPAKLYSGAIVTYPENNTDINPEVSRRIMLALKELHRLLKITKEFKKAESDMASYDMAHHVGLNTEEEFELLQLMREDQRMEYLKRHLAKVLPIIAEMESLKERVKLNGHFRELGGFNFDL